MKNTFDMTPTGDLHHTPVETTMGHNNCLSNVYKS